MRVLMIFLLLGFAACGRPLTEREVDFAKRFHGETLNTKKVRLAKTGPVRSYTLSRPIRPRVACSERIYPAPTTTTVTGAPSAVALFNRVFINPDYYLDEYTPAYPKTLHLYQAMFLAHELTHIWQWQNRKVTGYHPIKAAREHQTLDDPYLFDTETEKDLLDFGYEQQGAIVEEYLCCAVLDPKAPRTERLRRMVGKYLVVDQLPVHEIIVGWRDVQVKGICR